MSIQDLSVGFTELFLSTTREVVSMYGKKIYILITAYTVNNLGDDMFITLLCKHYANVSFLLQCPPEFSEVFLKIVNLTVISSLSKDIISQIDFQIFIGGSLFMEPQNKLEIEHKFRSVISCRISSSIPFFVIGANFGPYTEISHVNLYRDWFRKLDGISFRDRYSFNLFQDLPNVMWSPDLIFSYSFPHDGGHCKNITIVPIYNTGRIGLPCFSNEKYFLFLARTALEYLKKGYTITLASFCEFQMDNVACEEIYNAIPCEWKDKVFFIKYKNDINSFLEKFVNTEYVIGTRFHSIIIALKEKIPVFPIVYNQKTINIIKDYDYKGTYADDIMNLEQIDFNYVDYNRKMAYVPDYSAYEFRCKFQYHFFNEALITKWR